MFILKRKGDQRSYKKTSLTFFSGKFINSIHLELISEHTWKTRQSGTTYTDLPVVNHALPVLMTSMTKHGISTGVPSSGTWVMTQNANLTNFWMMLRGLTDIMNAKNSVWQDLGKFMDFPQRSLIMLKRQKGQALHLAQSRCR